MITLLGTEIMEVLINTWLIRLMHGIWLIILPYRIHGQKIILYLTGAVKKSRFWGWRQGWSVSENCTNISISNPGNPEKTCCLTLDQTMNKNGYTLRIHAQLLQQIYVIEM